MRDQIFSLKLLHINSTLLSLSMYLEAQIPNTVTALSVIGSCFIIMILIGSLSTA